jgi:hypothetical protein
LRVPIGSWVAFESRIIFTLLTIGNNDSDFEPEKNV